MRGVVMYAPGDVRVEELEDAKIVEPTDAVIRLAATCICGSDLWPYRGVEKLDGTGPMGHEYAASSSEIGSRREERQGRRLRRRLLRRLRQHV